MRFKLTFLLIALNLALFGYLLYLNKAGSTRDQLGDEARLVLSPSFSARIDHFTVESNALKNDWELRRNEADWEVVEPLRWPANRYAVEQLLFQLKRLRWESRFSVASLEEAGRDLSAYGLGDPALTLRLRGGGEEKVLRLGDPTEIGARLYVLSHDKSKVQVVPRDLLDALRRDPNAFYDPRVFSLSFEETKALQIQDQVTGNVRIRLVRDEEGWKFVSPMETEADDERVRTLLDQWQSLETGELLDPEELPVGFSGGTLRLTLEGLNRRETLVLSGTDEEDGRFFASRESYPAAFAIPESLVERLRRAQEELREKRFLLSLQDQWNSLEVRMNERSLTLQKLESGDWQVLYTTEEGNLRTLPAEEQIVAEINTLLGRAEASRFVTDAPSEDDLRRFGLEDPQRRILLRQPEKADVTLLVGGVHPEETLLYATTNTTGSVFLVRPQVLASFPLDPYYYRDRTFWTPSSGKSVQRVEMIHMAAGLDLLKKTSEEDSLRGKIREWTRDLTVERHVPLSFSKPLQLDEDRRLEWKYRLVLHLANGSAEDAPEPVSFLLTEPVGGGRQYIADPGTGEVGLLPPAIFRALSPVLAAFPKEPPSPPETGEPEAPETGEPEAPVENG